MRRRFTLLELFIVIALVGALSVMLVPTIKAERAKADRAKGSNTLRQLGLAAESAESPDTLPARDFFSGVPVRLGTS